METVRIVIPIYKTDFDNSEKVSLHRSLTVLKDHPFSIICPDNLDVGSVEQMFTGINYDIRRFAPDFFMGIKGYNKLMLSEIFYNSFSDCKYILICQTDVFVFSDQLLLWCEKDYDYIGAPWMASPQHSLKNFFYGVEKLFRRKKKSQHHFFKVGNGGFSLRKVDTMRIIVTSLKEQIDFCLYHKDEKKYYQEDVFISIYAPLHIPGIKIPQYTEAVAFSMDRRPHLAYKLNKYQLPFACHGFNKSSVREFWKPIISEFDGLLKGQY
jgi:hypothetical protein